MDDNNNKGSEVPAEGILKKADVAREIDGWSVECVCSAPSHSHSVMVDINDPFVSVFVTVTNDEDSILERIKGALTILFKGDVEGSTELLMTPQQARNYATTIEVAAQKIEDQSEQEYLPTLTCKNCILPI